jgi:hypothetical protein
VLRLFIYKEKGTAFTIPQRNCGKEAAEAVLKCLYLLMHTACSDLQ